MLHRIPTLQNATLEMLCNGPEAFSPDCKWIVGESPEIRNYFVAAGMKTVIILFNNSNKFFFITRKIINSL